MYKALPTSLKWYATKDGNYPEDYETLAFQNAVPRQASGGSFRSPAQTDPVLCYDISNGYYIAFREYGHALNMWSWASSYSKEHALSPAYWAFLSSNQSTQA